MNATTNASATAPVCTCQICGRAIKATNGKIAHHGYKRPGTGWQTNSCYGARELPYEVSCDAIPKAIAKAEKAIAASEAFVAKFMANPPATLTPKAYGYSRPAPVEKPEGFDSATARDDHRPRSYVSLFFSRIAEEQREQAGAKAFIEAMKVRLAAWKPAAEAAS